MLNANPQATKEDVLALFEDYSGTPVKNIDGLQQFTGISFKKSGYVLYENGNNLSSPKIPPVPAQEIKTKPIESKEFLVITGNLLDEKTAFRVILNNLPKIRDEFDRRAIKGFIEEAKNLTPDLGDDPKKFVIEKSRVIQNMKEIKHSLKHEEDYLSYIKDAHKLGSISIDHVENATPQNDNILFEAIGDKVKVTYRDEIAHPPTTLILDTTIAKFRESIGLPERQEVNAPTKFKHAATMTPEDAKKALQAFSAGVSEKSGLTQESTKHLSPEQLEKLVMERIIAANAAAGKIPFTRPPTITRSSTITRQPSIG